MKKGILFGALLSLALSSTSFAQTPCYAENDGATFSDGTSMGGPNLLVAIKFVAPSNLAVTSMEVFTGEGGGTNSLALWSHDTVNNQPSAALSLGSWGLSNVNSWQGAALSSTVNLTASTTYWAVWGCTNGAQASVQSGVSLGQQYRPSFDGGNSWSGPFQSTGNNWKFRLFCDSGLGVEFCSGDGSGTPCPCANAGVAGTGCANSTGVGAILSLGGSASVGADDLTVSITQGPPNTAAIVFTGTLQENGGAGSVFGDGLLCATGNIQRLSVMFFDGTGAATWGPALQAQGGWASGNTRQIQGWYRDPLGPCSTGFNTTQGFEVVFTP